MSLTSPISVGPVTIDAPVILAPMTGVTDLPFRRLVRDFGAGLVVSEMIASRWPGLVDGWPAALTTQPAVSVSASIQALMLTNCRPTPCQKVTFSRALSTSVSRPARLSFQASHSM